MDWLTVLAAAAALSSGLYWWVRSSSAKNFPPGPRGFPIIGNLLQFGRSPHLAILKWKEQYGDVFTVYNGQKPMVILSNYSTVKKVFSDDAATGRDQSSQIKVGTAWKDHGLILSEGDLWKTHRRFALSTLRDLGMGKNWLEDTIIGEVDGLCDLLRKTEGKPFNPKVHLTNSVSNVICALIFGKRFDINDPFFTRLTHGITESVETFLLDVLATTFPFLMWFPNPARSGVIQGKANEALLAGYMEEKIQEHEKMDKQEDVQDYLFAYQTERETGTKTPAKETFDERQLVASLMDLFGAGTETTSTTILWAFVFLFENLDVMRKMQEEIDQNVGRHRTLTNADRSLLPYNEAAILEIQRCASLLPLGFPHINRKEITVDGYTIPKGTTIMANLFSIHRDSRWWKNPQQFDPTRFLDDNMKLTRPDGFAPFLIGKRACLGEALAKMELFLFIANLLKNFTLELPPGKTISHDDYFASVVNSPNPFDVVFVPRA